MTQIISVLLAISLIAFTFFIALVCVYLITMIIEAIREMKE